MKNPAPFTDEDAHEQTEEQANDGPDHTHKQTPTVRLQTSRSETQTNEQENNTESRHTCETEKIDTKSQPVATHDVELGESDAATEKLATTNTDVEFGTPEDTAQQYIEEENTPTADPEAAITYMDVVGQHDLLRVRANVDDFSADTLIDGGSTHDIISPDFAERAGIPWLKACGQTTITLADGTKTSVVRQKTKHMVNYQIGTFSDARRFLIAPIGHDIILGKPWLTRHNPHINWETNTLLMRDGSHIIANEKKRGSVHIETISATQFKRMINRREEVQVYKVEVQESVESGGGSEDTRGVKLDHLPSNKAQELQKILSNYENTVFSEPRGLPPKRILDHKIEILPGSTPPSRSPYRLSQPELDELAKQLSHLIDQGWIKPSTSPFGAPILFVKKKEWITTDVRRLQGTQ